MKGMPQVLSPDSRAAGALSGGQSVTLTVPNHIGHPSGLDGLGSCKLDYCDAVYSSPQLWPLCCYIWVLSANLAQVG